MARLCTRYPRAAGAPAYHPKNTATLTNYAEKAAKSCLPCALHTTKKYYAEKAAKSCLSAALHTPKNTATNYARESCEVLPACLPALRPAHPQKYYAEKSCLPACLPACRPAHPQKYYAEKAAKSCLPALRPAHNQKILRRESCEVLPACLPACLAPCTQPLRRESCEVLPACHGPCTPPETYRNQLRQRKLRSLACLPYALHTPKKIPQPTTPRKLRSLSGALYVRSGDQLAQVAELL